jgi:NCAIR mutase (PurE)-related protein
VSSLRNYSYFAQVQTNLQAKTAAHKELEKEVKDSKDEKQRLKSSVSSHTRREAPSLDSTRRDTNGTRQVLTPHGKEHKLYSEAMKKKVARENVTKYKKPTTQLKQLKTS